MAKKRQLFWMLSVGGFLLAVLALSLITPADGQVMQPGGGKFKPKPKPNPKPAAPVVFKPGPGPVDPPKKDPPGTIQTGAIKLTQDEQFSDFLAAARDCIADKVWGDAANVLQKILDNTQDYYVNVVDENAAGQKLQRWTSMKYEANKLLGSMPPEGLKKYEELYGRLAEIAVDQAKKSGDVQKLGEAAQKYFHTKVGVEANDILATFFLDRGQFFQAALQYDRILTLGSKQAKIPTLTLFKAAIAFRRTGDVKRSDDIFKQMLPQLQADGGLKIGKQMVAIDKLNTVLQNMPKPQMVNPKDWTLVWGNVSNTAQSVGSQPLLGEILWKRSTVRDRLEIPNPPEPPYVDLDPDGGTKFWIDTAKAKMEPLHKQGVPIMPGFFPLAVEGKLIYRTYPGMAAVYLQDVMDENKKVIAKAGDIAWKSSGSEGGLARILSNGLVGGQFKDFIQNDFSPQYADFMNFIYENSLIGTMSADLKYVYMVDDVGIPIPPNKINTFFGVSNPGFGPVFQPANPSVKDKLFQNGLRAYDLHTGQLKWHMVGHVWEGKEIKVINPDLEESHFLGPPLPVAGKLYVLNEKVNGEIRLLNIDPTLPGTIVSEQKLGNVDTESRFTRDPNRRVHAVHLGYGEGILVCPTNCGQVLGIDLLSKSLAWAYPYRESKSATQPKQPPFPGPGGGFQPLPLLPATWKVTPPAIDQGKVVFTAPDAGHLHCINLRDGTQVWRRKKEASDLFLGGVWDGKVIVVSRNSCYALDLNTGNLLWDVATGALPSGQGVASKNVYYLPLENGEIVAIDIHKGAIKAHNRPAGGPVPGNLIFHEGVVVSQTLEEIFAFPQLETKKTEIEVAFKKTPNDLKLMLMLSELRLGNGEVKEAVELLYALKGKNPPADMQAKFQQRLFEALTDLFDVDFKTARTTYLKDYEVLCKQGDDREQQKRLGNLYRLLGTGLEKEGELLGAFENYRKYGSLPMIQTEGVPSKDDPLRKIPAKVWLRGRITSLNEKLKTFPDQKKPLEEKIDQEWLLVSKSNDLSQIRGFVDMFDGSFKVGQLARLQLANAIMAKADPAAYLEAELSLEQLRSGKTSEEISAKALEGLARLEIQKRSMKLAAEYYRQLAEEFPNVVIRDGKTGKDLFNELAAKKIFLPHLEAAGTLWGNSKFKQRWVKDIPDAPPFPTLEMMFNFKGDLNPATAQMRLLVEIYNPKLRLVELASGKELWNLPLTPQETHSAGAFKPFFPPGDPTHFPNAHCRQAFTKGHLTVVQVGAMAYAIDLSKAAQKQPALLWKQPLMNEQLSPQVNTGQTGGNFDAHGHLLLTFKVTNFFPPKVFPVRLGYVAAVQASYVAVVDQEKLIVIDPLSNNPDQKPNVLWSRATITEETEVFGDEDLIYLVDVVNGVATNARALRAADGTPVTIPDFSIIYQKRLHQTGSTILAATNVKNKTVLRLYDLPTGKDLWSEAYHPDTVVLKTVDPYLTGVIEPNGKMTVVDLKARKVVLETSVLQGRVTKADLKNLTQPLLLADRDHFYVALNQPVDQAVISGGQIMNNFDNGLRCEQVNGWFGAFHRADGSKNAGGKIKNWQKGDLHWYSSDPIANQMVVVENFDQMPLLVFSARYHEKLPGPAVPTSKWATMNQSLDKATGKWAYCPTESGPSNGVPSFKLLTVDPQRGTINLLSVGTSLQYYVDDGRPQVGTIGDNQPAPAPPPFNAGPPLTAEAFAKIQAVSAELQKLGMAGIVKTYEFNLPGHGPIGLQSGNPVMVVRPGQPPLPLDTWLNLVKPK